MNKEITETIIKSEDIELEIKKPELESEILSSQTLRIPRTDFIALKTYKFCSIFANYPFICFGIGFSIHLSFVLLTLLLHYRGLAEVVRFSFDDLPLMDNKYEPFQCFRAWIMLYKYKFQLGYDMSLFIRYPNDGPKNLFRIYYDSIVNDNILTSEILLKIKEFELEFIPYFQRIGRCYLYKAKCRELNSIINLFLLVNPKDTNFVSLQKSLDLIISNETLKRQFILSVSNDFRKNISYKTKAVKTEINLRYLTILQLNEIIGMMEKFNYKYSKHFNLYFENSFLLAEILFDQVKKDAQFIPGCILFIFFFTWLQTRSFFVTSLGILSIITTFFCANLVHSVVLGIKYFGFFHVLSIFLILGLGCDNIYVFYDRWKSFDNIPIADLSQRLTDTLLGISWSMFITNITTTMAFFILIWTPLLVISTFGLFVSLLIVINYISVVFYFPSIIIIHHLKFGGKNKHHETFFIIAKFFKEQYFQFLNKRFIKHIILGMFGCIAIIAVTFISKIKVAEKFPDLLVSSTLYGKMIKLQEKYFEKAQVDENLQILILNGLKGLDFSNCSFWDFKCMPKFIFDNNLLINENDTQEQFQKICTDIIESNETRKNALGLFNDTRNHILCLPLDMNRYFLTKFPDNSFYIPWNSKIFLQLLEKNPDVYGVDIPNGTFPYKFETALYYFLSDGYTFSSNNSRNYNSYRFRVNCKRTKFTRYIQNGQYSELTYGHKLNYSAILINITLFKLMSGFTEKKRVFDNWIHLVNHIRKSLSFHVMVCGSQPDISFNGYFHWVHVQQSLNSAAIKGIVLGLVVAIPILIFATHNIYTFIIILLGTVLSTITVISIIGIFKWDLGLIESIIVSIVVGLTIDYPVHMGLAYNNSDLPTREAKTRQMLKEMGVSILSGMITTLGSAFFLFFCKVTFLLKFGIFIFVTITSAGIYALLFLPSFFLTFGPINNQGKFGNYFKENLLEDSKQ